MGCSVELKVGDITEFDGDAIVNPANTLLIMGGGVAGAIKRKGGGEIEEEARRHAPLRIGEAVVTRGGFLKAKYVIHAPTVEQPGGTSSEEWVYKATKAALKVAKERRLESIAFPLMGAGVGGLTPEQSLKAMAKAFFEEGECPRIYVYVLNSELLDRLRPLLKA